MGGNWVFPFSPGVDQLIDLALFEDLSGGDLTSDALFAATDGATATALARDALVVAGLPVFRRVMERVDPRLEVRSLVEDGARLDIGAALVTISGSARSLLRAERTALNFLCQLSGVATLTHAFVVASGPDGPRIVDTRKTTPGFRELQKYAVRMGGGHNHRFNLGSAAMIKDNHIAAAGSITGAVVRVRAQLPHTAKIEVEVANLVELDEALEAGADIIMLDNMSDDDTAEAVRRASGRAITEASGRVTLDRIRTLRTLGVDIISSGSLTHSAPTADISLEIDLR